MSGARAIRISGDFVTTEISTVEARVGFGSRRTFESRYITIADWRRGSESDTSRLPQATRNQLSKSSLLP